MGGAIRRPVGTGTITRITAHQIEVLCFRRYRAEATPSDGTAPGFDAPCISSDADEVKIRAADFRTAAPQLSRVTLSQ
jgi:hypothetical protein